MGDTQVASFSLATTKGRRGEDGNWVDTTEWHNISLWGNAAEGVAKRATKGSLVAVEGSLKYESFENKEGRRVNITKIRAFQVLVLVSKGERKEGAGSEDHGQQQAETGGEDAQSNLGFGGDDDDGSMPWE